MSSSLLWSDQAPPPPAPEPERRRRRRRPPLALLLVMCSLAGGGTTVGALAATGTLGGETTTLVDATNASTTTASGLDAEALFAAASPGVVDITAGSGSGTGFVIDTDGHILTAAHVVDGASSVTVTLTDGTTRSATVLGADDATDAAVLKIDPDGLDLRPLTLGSSADVAVGEAVAAIGDPFGYERSLSTGIISGTDRTITAPNGFTVAHALQTDTAINPGNSGGPILNAAGQVIGIADQIATDGSSEQSSGVGFAIPIDLVKAELDPLKAGQDVQHAYLGVATGDGAKVEQVTAGGPAASAGLQAGDVITQLGDARVSDQNDLVAAIAAHRPGDQVKVTVQRGDGTTELTVTLGTQPAQTG